MIDFIRKYNCCLLYTSYTDGIGAKQTKNLKSQLQATIRVVGSPVSNVANTFLACTKDSSGDTYTVASGVTNYSDHAANMEITLYEGKKILEVRTLSLAACLLYTSSLILSACRMIRSWYFRM